LQTELPIGPVAGMLGATQAQEWLEEKPRYTMDGEEMAARGSAVYLPAETDVPFRLLLPFKGVLPKVFIGDQVLGAWNRLHPEKQERVDTIARDYTLPGSEQKHWMSEGEYEDVNIRAGAILKEMVASREWDTDNPSSDDITVLKRMISTARSAARRSLIGELLGQ